MITLNRVYYRTDSIGKFAFIDTGKLWPKICCKINYFTLNLRSIFTGNFKIMEKINTKLSSDPLLSL